MASTVASKYRRVSVAALVLLAAAVLSAAPSPARADEKEEARKLLEEGDKHMHRGDQRRAGGRDDRAASYYKRALESYQKAYQLVPKSSIFFAIAEVEAKLGQHMDAITHYQKVIAEVDSEELKQQARQRLQELRPLVAALVLTVVPDGAEISIDGQLRGVAPLAEPILLAAGDHTITVTAEGYSPYEEAMPLEVGVETKREIRLEKIPVVVKTPMPADPSARPAKTSSRRAWVAAPKKGKLVIGTVATGTLLAGATVTGLLAMSKHSTFEDPEADPDDRASARDSGKTLALVTDILIIGTAVAAGYTAYQYFAVYRPQRETYERDQERRKDPNFWMSPYYDGTSGGLAVAGRF